MRLATTIGGIAMRDRPRLRLEPAPRIQQLITSLQADTSHLRALLVTGLVLMAAIFVAATGHRGRAPVPTQPMAAARATSQP